MDPDTANRKGDPALKLEGRIAVITGAAQGIGRQIAARYAAEGARIAVLDHNHAAATDAANGIGPPARAYAADVGDQTSVEAAVSGILADLGRIDILVNNAAAPSPHGKVTDLDPAAFRKTLDVNVTGAFLMSRAVLPDMIARKSGRIINVASQLGSVATRMNPAYCAAKGAVLQLTRAMALDHAEDGVLVNSLSPGAVLTPRLLAIYGTEEAAAAALADKHPVGRLGRPDDIAGGAVFLASEDAGFMTGADLVIDGGYLAQ